MVFKEDTHPFKENKFVQYVRARIRKNKNCIIIITGPTGSGKSWAGMALAEAIDPKRVETLEDGTTQRYGFDASRVAFTASEYLALVQKKLYPGAVILFDEAGTGMNSRRAMSHMNVAMSSSFQTVRYKRHVIILTVPSMSMVDKNVRMVCHLMIKTEKIDYKAGLTQAKVYTLVHSNMKDKIYTPYPKLHMTNGQTVSIAHLLIGKPTYGLLRAYESVKARFGERITEQGLIQVSDGAKKEDMGVTARERSVYEAITKWKLKPSEIAERLGITRKAVFGITSNLRAKGYFKVRDKDRIEKVVNAEVS